MFWANALGWARAVGWPIFVAAMLSLAGCSGIRPATLGPTANESGTQVPPIDSSSALRLARATRQAGDIASALQLYRNIVATTSADPEILVEFGDVQLQAGSPDDAIDTYSRVGARSSARLGALLGLTRAYLDLGDPTKALGFADEAQGIAPQDARVLVDRGVALDTLKRHADAQACYRAVLVTAPRHVAARNNLALSLALTGHYDEAIALMAPLVRSTTATPKERENMAVIYGLMGDADRAALLSRVDLDAGTTEANLAFLAAVRGTKP
jgi:Flp pilus assembly protein TadD